MVFEVDGSQKSGSGTILRFSIALSAVTSQPLHIFNIRAKRPQPGLKPQHLEAVLTAAKLCNAKMEGAVLRSRELWFTPNQIRGGAYEAEIGTAGSIPMLLLTVLPMCSYAAEAVQLHIAKGGTDTWSAPTINYLRFVLLPTLKKMGLSASLVVHRYGYYPKGMGEVTMTVEPCRKLQPFRLTEVGNIINVRGYSVCTFLADRHVAQRQADAARARLAQLGFAARIDVVNDTSNPLQKGSSIVLWAETDSGVILGADAIGELGKSSESVGREAAEKLFAEIQSRPTVDFHVADMLIPYAALAEGSSKFLIRKESHHLETNIWLAEKLVGTKFVVTKMDGLSKVEKVR
jgi:RNA 3'-terminal phosphate cyclase (ATP)